MKFLDTLAAAAVALAAALPAMSLPASSQAADATLRYGHVNSGSADPLDEIGWGLHRGIIQEELKKIGITEITVAPGMVGPDLNDALNSGSLDLVTYGDGPAVVARAIGTPTRLIDFSSVKRQTIIVTRPDWPQDLKSLDGKKIAVVVGSTMHRQADEFLRNNGVNATFVSGGNDLSLLQSGAVDAIASLALQRPPPPPHPQQRLQDRLRQRRPSRLCMVAAERGHRGHPGAASRSAGGMGCGAREGDRGSAREPGRVLCLVRLQDRCRRRAWRRHSSRRTRSRAAPKRSSPRARS